MEIINFYCAKHYILDVMKKPKLLYNYNNKPEPEKNKYLSEKCCKCDRKAVLMEVI